MANYLDMSRCHQHVRNKSLCNWILETTRHNRHTGLLRTPTCYELVADLLRGNWCSGFWPLLRFPGRNAENKLRGGGEKIVTNMGRRRRILAPSVANSVFSVLTPNVGACKVSSCLFETPSIVCALWQQHIGPTALDGLRVWQNIR